MLTSASFSSPTQRNEDNVINAASTAATTVTLDTDNVALPATVQYVRHVRLPCRRVPGPPVKHTAVAASADHVELSTTHPAASKHPPHSLITQSFAGPSGPQSASAAASPVVAHPTQSASATSQERSETPFQAAQQFLASSGASLLYFANSSFYLTVRNSLDSGHTDSNADAEELSTSAQENLLTSAAAAAALRERFSGASASHTSSSSNTNTCTGVGGVEWKKLLYVRQQCRFTGDALVTAPFPATPRSTATSAEAAPAAEGDAPAIATEKSVGSRFMQSLLHPFSSSATSSSTTAAPSGTAANGCGARASPTSTPTSQSTTAAITVPHGEGVMTYVLYAMPKPDYHPTTSITTTSTTIEKSAVPLSPPTPFLSPELIPTSFCPDLACLDESQQQDGHAERLLLLSLVVYEGCFVEGRRHGRGRLTVCGRIVLECAWEHDLPCLTVPRTPVSAVGSPPTLRRIDAHVRNSGFTASSGAAATASAMPALPPSWTLRTRQAYMGSLLLCMPVTKRVLAKMEHAGTLPLVNEVCGTQYVRLPVLSSPNQASRDTTAVSQAFSGLTWANHVVFLPDGFGEVRCSDDSTSTFSPSSRTLGTVVPTSCGPFHPPLWAPETPPSPSATLSQSPLLLAATATQYCGEWSFGLPHGFGVEVQRLTDPSCAPLMLTSATAGAGPPQYPWRTLFVGQYAQGSRRGPGTLHALQGSEATEIVVCGTWPCEMRAGVGKGAARESVNVVLLPSAASNGRGGNTASSFFTLQGARWSAEEDGDAFGHGSSGGGGSFPSATLRQSPAALSGMWEPLFRDVDDVVSRPAAPLDFAEGGTVVDGAGTDGETAATQLPASKSVLWQHTRRVMDHLTQSPECVAALRTFQACFACIYGFDGVRAEESTSCADGKSEKASSSASVCDFLAQLKAVATSSTASTTSISYPWSPEHSWCAFAHLGSAGGCRASASPSSSFHTCLHEPLPDGATHQRPTRHSSQSTSASHSSPSARRPPLSAVAAALEPHAAAHTFAHAMHAAAAMVSSLRLRLLSCVAAYPDLCEVVMTSSAAEDGVLAYCWDVVYAYVAPLLHEKAAAVAVADVRMVWELLGLDRVNDAAVSVTEGETSSTASLPHGEVDLRTVWHADEKKTLRDFLVALRRCRGLRCDDFVDVSALDRRDADGQRCVEAAVAFLSAPSEGSEAATAAAAAAAAGEQTQVRDKSLGATLRALCELRHRLDDALGLPNCCSSQEILHGASAPAAAAAATAVANENGEEEGFDAQPGAAPSHREALLRWVLLAASTPSPASPSESAKGPPSARATHPFSTLLITAYLLGGRVTPSYPVVDCLSREERGAAGVQTRSMMCLLRDVGLAARQLLHTYPSLRAQTYPSPSVCPLDVLSYRLEYVMCPCAAQHLLSSTDVPTSAVSPLTHTSPEGCWEEGEETSHFAATPKDACIVDGGAAVCVQLNHLPDSTLHWCDKHLTDDLTERVLRARLHHYWTRSMTAVAADAESRVAVRDGPAKGGSAGVLSCPPTPLMRWVLACLQTSLRSPMRRPASQALDTAAATATATAPALFNGVLTWKKFINAVFFTAEEKQAWAEAAATSAAPAGEAASRVAPLSSVDYIYLVALAHTLRELCGVDVSLTAHFVLQDDEEDDDDVDGGPADGRSMTDTTMMDAFSGGPLEAGSGRRLHTSSRKLHGRSAATQSDRRRNIFLSSSDSSVSVSSESSESSAPPQDVDASPHNVDDRVRSGIEDGEEAAAAVENSPVHSEPIVPVSSSSPPPQTGDAPAESAAEKTSPHRDPVRAQQPVRRSQSAIANMATATVVPLGKEWLLAVRFLYDTPDASADAGKEIVLGEETSSAFEGSLLWEAVERVCSSVEYRLQEKKTTAVPAAETAPHTFNTRRR